MRKQCALCAYMVMSAVHWGTYWAATGTQGRGGSVGDCFATWSTSRPAVDYRGTVNSNFSALRFRFSLRYYLPGLQWSLGLIVTFNYTSTTVVEAHYSIVYFHGCSLHGANAMVSRASSSFSAILKMSHLEWKRAMK